MSDYDYIDAKDYVQQSFAIERRRLDAMHRCVNTGSIYTMMILDEKATHTLGSVILQTAFGFALGAIGGGLALTKRWKAYKEANEIMLERVDYIKTTLTSAGKSINTIVQAADSDAQAQKKKDAIVVGSTKASILINKIHETLKEISKVRVKLNKEERLYLEFLKVERDNGVSGLEKMAREDVPQPKPVSESEHSGLPIAYAYHLLGEYAKNKAAVIKTYREGWEMYDKHTKLSGFNNTQEKKIYEMFSRKNIVPHLDQSKVKPIQNHKDMIKHWKVREAVNRVHQPATAVGQW